MACNPADKADVTIEHDRLFSFVLDDSINELSTDSIINIQGQTTTLYGKWEILFNKVDSISGLVTKNCGILTVRSSCDGTDGVGAVTTTYGKKINEITIAYSYIRDTVPVSPFDYDLSTLVDVMDASGPCVINDHFEFNIIGFRWQDDLLGGDIYDSRRRR